MTSAASMDFRRAHYVAEVTILHKGKEKRARKKAELHLTLQTSLLNNNPTIFMTNHCYNNTQPLLMRLGMMNSFLREEHS